jgi:hypothetical protein
MTTSQFTVFSNVSASDVIQEKLVKEDVNDLISNLFPLDTPLQQALGKRQMQSTFCEFPIDTFTTIRRTSAVTLATSGLAGVNAQPEAAAFSAPVSQYPARLKAVAEIQKLSFEVSGSDRAVSAYGYTDRFTYEAAKNIKAVVNNIEHDCWWGVGSTVGGAVTGGVPVRYTQGLMYWIFKTGLSRQISGNLTGNCTTNTTFVDGNGNDFSSTNATLCAGAATWAFNANGTALDAAMFKDSIMRPWYTLMGQQGGAMGFASPRVKTLINGFAQGLNGQINERTIEAASRMLVDDISYYDTEYGIVSINMSRYLNLSGQSFTVTAADNAGAAGLTSITVPADENLVLIKPDYFKIGVLRGVHFYPIGKAGDSDRGEVCGEMGLVCLNPQGGTGACNLIP